ncbi:hypothetical protein HanLR1_Chr06g0205031 [Helianthus annuus]|nr:hypothetical protein HanLR1_Chr06g0205031 [Helianthus annuus]
MVFVRERVLVDFFYSRTSHRYTILDVFSSMLMWRLNGGKYLFNMKPLSYRLVMDFKGI